MKKKLFRFTTIIVAISLALMACSLTTLSKPASNSSGATQQAGTPGGAISTDDGTNLPGSAGGSLSNGLDSLKAYQAVLKIDFNGTSAGEKSQWGQTFTLRVDSDRGGRILTIDAPGGSSENTMDGRLSGDLDGVSYSRTSRMESCLSDLRDASKPDPQVLQPIMFGPQVDLSAMASKEEALDGTPAVHYTLDERSLGLQDGKAQGDLWLAKAGGYVIKYHITASSDKALLDPDLQGSITWDYALAPGKPADGFTLPDDCTPGLGDRIPRMADAVIGKQLPGYLEYTSASDAKDIAEFYLSKLAPLGYSSNGTPELSNLGVTLEFTDPAQTLSVMIKGGSPAQVIIILQNGQPEPVDLTEPTIEPTAAAGLDSTKRISAALGLTMGSKDKPGVYSSYHLDVKQNQPVLDQKSGKITQEEDDISADVSGSDVHASFTKTAAGGKPEMTEGYLVGGQAYKVVLGKAQPDVLGITIAWASWPLDVIQPLTLASVSATSMPVETLDGRSADVFAIDTSTADPTTLDSLKGMLPLNPTINSAKGTIWLDQQTGGLLKLVLDYEAEIKDLTSGTSIGKGNGHLEITFSKVGAVVVTLP